MCLQCLEDLPPLLFEKLQYFGSDDHKYEIVQRDIEENKSYQESLKKRDVCYDFSSSKSFLAQVNW